MTPDMITDNLSRAQDIIRRLEAENAKLRDVLVDLDQCDEWGVFSTDEVKLRTSAALKETPEPAADEVKK